jgi:GAF domain-containing protein
MLRRVLLLGRQLRPCERGARANQRLLQGEANASGSRHHRWSNCVEAKTIHVSDVLADDEYTLGDVQKIVGYRAALGAPLLREGNVVGVIILERSVPHPFSAKQIELAATFADQAVIAIENVRLFDEVQARTRELAHSVEEVQALGEVTQAVNSTLDLETVLSTIVAKAVQLSGTGGGAIYVFDESEQLFRLRATYGFSEDLVAAVQDQHLGEIRQATQARQPQEIADIRDEPPSPVREIAMRAGYRARLTVPLLSLIFWCWPEIRIRFRCGGQKKVLLCDGLRCGVNVSLPCST